MNVLMHAMTSALIHAVWQHVLVALLLWVALLWLRRRSPNVRYVAACAALATMAILPVITTVALLLRAVPAEMVPPAGTVQPRDFIEYSQAGSRIWTSTPFDRTSSVGGLQEWVLPVWLVGVLVFSLRLVGAGRHTVSLKRRGMPADEALMASVTALAASLGIARRVTVLISRTASCPATVGWLKPVILLPPAAVLGLTPEQLEAVLAHELAHIRRHDYLVNLLQMVVETLFFYHPAVWWASNRIRTERELCCDEVAVRSCGDVLGYAQALTTIARLPVANAGMVGSTGGPLVHRIERLLRPSLPARAASPWPGVVVVGLVVLSTALTAHWAQGQSRQNAPQRDPATLSLTVYDPLGAPAENVLLIFEQGPFENGLLFGDGRTDSQGRYRVRLPAGTYLFSGLIDFFPPTRVTLKPGENIHREIRMQVDTLTSAFTVCIDCADATYSLPDSIVEELQRDRDAAAMEVVTPAEPAGGWESYRPHVPQSLRRPNNVVGGTVVVEGRISADGRVVGLRVASAPHPELARAAVAALEDQRWEPARVRGVPIEVPLRLTFRYVRAGGSQ